MSSTIYHPAANSRWISQLEEDLYEGADWSRTFTWETRATVGGATTPVDLTGTTWSCSFREDNLDATALFTLTVGSGVTLTDAANGDFTLAITDTQVATIDQSKKGLFDCMVTFPSGTKSLFPAVIVFTTYKTASGQ